MLTFSIREQNKYLSNLLFVPLNKEHKCSILSKYSRLCMFAQKWCMVDVDLLKIQWSQLSGGEEKAQTETERLRHILSRDLYLDSVKPCQYLQLTCEEDAQNMLGSEQWEVLPRNSNKGKIRPYLAFEDWDSESHKGQFGASKHYIAFFVKAQS